MYLREDNSGCELSYLVANQTWLSTQNSLTWLYSTSEQITVRCKRRAEVVTTIKRTDQVTLNADCKLLTRKMHIKTRRATTGTQMRAYVPGYKLSLSRFTPTHVKNLTGVKLQPVLSGKEMSQDGDEVSKLFNSVDNV